MGEEGRKVGRRGESVPGLETEQGREAGGWGKKEREQATSGRQSGKERGNEGLEIPPASLCGSPTSNIIMYYNKYSIFNINKGCNNF